MSSNCLMVSMMTKVIGFITVLTILLVASGCGNTVTGIGQDIVETGEKITKWQNSEDDK